MSRAEFHTMTRMAMPISKPMIGSSKGKADPDADGASQHGQRGEAIRAGVITISD